MAPHRLEQYEFYRLYSIDFDSVLHSIRVLRRYRRKDVRYCLLREIVVSYARPFSGNQGQLLNKHFLKKKTVIPKRWYSLHTELLDLRNEQFAHTSHVRKNPKVVKWSRFSGPRFPMSFQGYDYENLDTRIDEIEGLVRAVSTNLQATIREMEGDL